MKLSYMQSYLFSQTILRTIADTIHHCCASTCTNIRLYEHFNGFCLALRLPLQRRLFSRSFCAETKFRNKDLCWNEDFPMLCHFVVDELYFCCCWRCVLSSSLYIYLYISLLFICFDCDIYSTCSWNHIHKWLTKEWTNRAK